MAPKRLLVVYNSAAHYRESIFRLMDESFDCDYVFGQENGNIKQFDTSVLDGAVTLVKNKRIGHFYYQHGVLRKSLRNNYDRLLFLGDTRCISTWISSMLVRLFCPFKRIYFWTHGWYGKETKKERCLKVFFFRLANGGLFLYGNYARDLMVMQGFNPEKLYVIHNSLSYQQQYGLRSCLEGHTVFRNHFHNVFPTLLFVGRLTKVKHLDLLLGALCRTENPYNLVVIGDGSEKEMLVDLTHRLALDERVWFYGPSYDEKELSRLIGNADLCVSPGNVGLTAMHSMVYGTPVLTHNDFMWQMPEFEAIHEGETGAFFNRDDVDSLARAIDDWFSQEGYNRELIRKNCYAEIDNYWTPKFQLEVLKEYLI